MVNKWNKESYATVKSGILYILQQFAGQPGDADHSIKGCQNMTVMVDNQSAITEQISILT